MGRVVTRIKLANVADLDNVERGFIQPEDVRSVEVDALVDTGATMLVLPEDVVRALGVARRGQKTVNLADGTKRDRDWVRGICLEILGREMTCDALVMPTGTTPLIGQIPLEGLDLIVDPRSREVRVNPASPDTPQVDVLAAS
jgi:clan AA aspartic protease